MGRGGCASATAGRRRRGLTTERLVVGGTLRRPRAKRHRPGIFREIVRWTEAIHTDDFQRAEPSTPCADRDGYTDTSVTDRSEAAYVSRLRVTAEVA